MFARNTIKFAHVALGLVPEILDAIDMIMLGREQLGMVDAVIQAGERSNRIIPVLKSDFGWNNPISEKQ